MPRFAVIITLLGSVGVSTFITVSLNVPFTPPNATCVFDSIDGDEQWSSPASPGAEAGQVICDSPQLSPTGADGTSSIQVSLAFLNKSLTQNPLIFTYYDCISQSTCPPCDQSESSRDCGMAHDCTSCLTMRGDGCGWCATNRLCQEKSACPSFDRAWYSERCPVISALKPPFGFSSGGDLIDIQGSAFVEGSGLLCRFGNLAPSYVTFVSDALVRCVAPSGAVGDMLRVSLEFENGTMLASTDQRFYILADQFDILYLPSNTSTPESEESLSSSLVPSDSTNTSMIVTFTLASLVFVLILLVILLILWSRARMRKLRGESPETLSSVTGVNMSTVTHRSRHQSERNVASASRRSRSSSPRQHYQTIKLAPPIGNSSAGDQIPPSDSPSNSNYGRSPGGVGIYAEGNTGNQ